MDDSTGFVGCARRYRFLRYRAEIRNGTDLEAVWDAKRREISGTPLPIGFAAQTTLVAAGVLVIEELVGASDMELSGYGLSLDQISSVKGELQTYVSLNST